VACYVVTGGAGFIGSHLVRRLVQEQHRLRVVDDLSSGCIPNMGDDARAVTFIKGSVCDAPLLERAFDGADVVFHQAAVPSVQRSVQDPLATNRANVQGTLQVLEAARKRGVRRVVYASSSSVYGDAAALPKSEDMCPAPASPYAASKLGGELYCRVYAELFGVETVALRYFNVFGPRQDPESQYAAVIPLFITALLGGRRPMVFGDGEQSRDFTYVDNVVDANLLAANAPVSPGLAVNIGCGVRVTLNEVLRLLGEMLGVDAQADHAEERPGDVKHSQADIGLARKALGYEPRIGFEEGLRRTVEWYKEWSGGKASP